MALSTGRSFGWTPSRKPSLPTGSLGHVDQVGDVARHARRRPARPGRPGPRAPAPKVSVSRTLTRSGYVSPASAASTVGPGLVVEAEEHDAVLRGLDVVGLLVLLVGPDVAVQIDDVRVRIALADLVRGLEGRGAADPRAVLVELPARPGLVHALDLAAADAVDERDRARHPALDLEVGRRSDPPGRASGGAGAGSRHAASGRSRTRPRPARSGRSRSRRRSRPTSTSSSVGSGVEVDADAAGRHDAGPAAGAGAPNRWPARSGSEPGYGRIDRLAAAQAVVELVGDLDRAGRDRRHRRRARSPVTPRGVRSQRGREVADVAGQRRSSRCRSGR